MNMLTALMKACIDVHMYLNGSFDDLTKEGYEENLSYIIARLKYWKPSPSSSMLFDTAIKLVCVAVVEEAKKKNES